MFAERFGSYSIPATRAGMPNLSRLKSITRYNRLCPPPRCQEVTWPLTLRPPLLLSRPPSSERSGLRRESSEKSETLMSRRPGVVGLKVRTGIALHPLEELDALAFRQLHERLLPLGL